MATWYTLQTRTRGGTVYNADGVKYTNINEVLDASDRQTTAAEQIITRHSSSIIARIVRGST